MRDGDSTDAGSDEEGEGDWRRNMAYGNGADEYEPEMDGVYPK